MIAFNIQYVSAYDYKSDKYYDYDIIEFYSSRAYTTPIFDFYTIDGAILNLSFKDSGAKKVLRELVLFIMGTHPKIMTPLRTMQAFDQLGIIGSKISMLYEDVCKKSIECVYACVWSVLTRNLPKEILYFAIENHGEGINLISLLETFDKEISIAKIRAITYELLAAVLASFIIFKIVTFAVESDARTRVNDAILRGDFYR